jgi:hypothetical protein
MVVSGQVHDLAAVPLGKEPLAPIEEGAGWVPQPVYVLGNKNALVPAKNGRIPSFPVCHLIPIPTKLSCLHVINCPSVKPFGGRGDAVGWGTMLQIGRLRVRLPMVSVDFFIGIILSAALWPWGRLSL